MTSWMQAADVAATIASSEASGHAYRTFAATVSLNRKDSCGRYAAHTPVFRPQRKAHVRTRKAALTDVLGHLGWDVGAQGSTVQAHNTSRGVVQPSSKSGDGGLATARCSDNACTLARVHCKRDVVQNLGVPTSGWVVSRVTTFTIAIRWRGRGVGEGSCVQSKTFGSRRARRSLLHLKLRLLL